MGGRGDGWRGQLVGDPLEVEMFEESGEWVMGCRWGNFQR